MHQLKARTRDSADAKLKSCCRLLANLTASLLPGLKIDFRSTNRKKIFKLILTHSPYPGFGAQIPVPPCLQVTSCCTSES